MEFIVDRIEKMKPFFIKVSRNVYLRSIKDGFISAMPVILFSSIFLLIVNVPNIWGFYWPEEIATLLMKPYDYSMGIIGLLIAATTAKSFTDLKNREMDIDNQINSVSIMAASIVGFLLLSTDFVDGGFLKDYMGTTGLLTSFISAFVTVHIYQFSIRKNLTLKMPEEVPPNISQTFKDVIPFGMSILVLFGLDTLVRNTFGTSVAAGVLKIFQPLFTAADGYLGLAIIAGATSFFWFLGIHGPSIVEPAIAAIMYSNMEANLELARAGKHASNVLTQGGYSFAVNFGGTGATFVVPYLLLLFAKSKQLKATGKAAVIPSSFCVNEPTLFGVPLVLNPVFFIPFLLAPIVNIWLVKFFIEVLGMNGPMYAVPWTIPGPIGIVVSTGMDKLSIVLAITMIVVDAIIYAPFLKVFDRQLVQEEAERALEDEEIPTVEFDKDVVQKKDSQVKVLVLCAGGGTSGLLANTLNKGAKEHDLNLVAAADSYGNHMDKLQDFNVVVLAPQVASNYDDMKKDVDRVGAKLLSVEGQEYIRLTRDVDRALNYIYTALDDN